MSDFPEVLQNHWYAVGTSDSLDFEVLSVRLLSKKFVLWRTPDGEIGAALDSCPHRQAPL